MQLRYWAYPRVDKLEASKKSQKKRIRSQYILCTPVHYDVTVDIDETGAPLNPRERFLTEHPPNFIFLDYDDEHGAGEKKRRSSYRSDLLNLQLSKARGLLLKKDQESD